MTRTGVICWIAAALSILACSDDAMITRQDDPVPPGNIPIPAALVRGRLLEPDSSAASEVIVRLIRYSGSGSAGACDASASLLDESAQDTTDGDGRFWLWAPHSDLCAAVFAARSGRMTRLSPPFRLTQWLSDTMALTLPDGSDTWERPRERRHP